MAVSLEYAQEQREAQAAIICDLFGLSDSSAIGRDWSMEGIRDGALLKITLLKQIDRETVHGLLNGRPLTPAEPQEPISGDNSPPGSPCDTHDGTHPHNTKGDA